MNVSEVVSSNLVDTNQYFEGLGDLKLRLDLLNGIDN